MSFKNNPRFTADVDQKIRERLARSRNSFQTLTRGIYPESGQSTAELVDQNPSETNGNSPSLNDREVSAVSVGHDSSTPPQNESSKVCQDLSMRCGEK
jgi:hypothetical protein